MIFFICGIAQRYLSWVLDQLEMQDYFFIVLFIALIFQEFKYAEIAYHFCFETAFKRNEELIVNARSGILAMYKEYAHKWWAYLIKNLVALGALISNLLPGPIKGFTNPIFERMMANYDQAYA